MTAKRTARVALGVLVLAGVAICQTKAVRVPEPARRLALVIGNAEYAENGLANPEGDARLIETTLKGLGFDDVVLETNLETLPPLRGAVRESGRGTVQGVCTTLGQLVSDFSLSSNSPEVR